MSKFGINVPPGKPAFSLEDVKKAAEEMKDENNEVCLFMRGSGSWLVGGGGMRMGYA